MSAVSESPDRSAVPLYALLTPLVRGWRFIAASALVVGALTAVVVALTPRDFRAPMALSTIFHPRIPSLGGGLGALLASGASPGGLQATPALVVQLARQRGVLTRVAATPVAPGGPTIGDRLREVEDEAIPERAIPDRLGRWVKPGFDRQTGVIQLEVVGPDSALARVIARELVAEISRTFVLSSKAQASEIRRAMDARVDSASRQLRSAEAEMRAFIAANRVVSPSSGAWMREQQLTRDLTIAQTVYTQSVTDREAAIGRELEATPAVVVLDELPAELLPAPRRLAIKTLLGMMAAAFIAAFLLLLRSGVQQAERVAPQALGDFSAALEAIPLVGSPLRRMIGLGAPPVAAPVGWDDLSPRGNRAERDA